MLHNSNNSFSIKNNLRGHNNIIRLKKQNKIKKSSFLGIGFSRRV